MLSQSQARLLKQPALWLAEQSLSLFRARDRKRALICHDKDLCMSLPWHLMIMVLSQVSCYATCVSLQWRHNGRDSVSNHHLMIVYSIVYSDADQRKHQSSASPFPAQMASYTENVSIWWRHHVTQRYLRLNMTGWRSGPRLNINTVFPCMGIYIIKIRRSSGDQVSGYIFW